MEHKLARICWNDFGWQRPSGRDGKTRNDKAFEDKTGFGHEEWLFDTSKIIDGYHYGYTQAVSASREKYMDKVFDLSFYAIDDRSKQRWWLGTVRNVVVVGEKESARVYELYEQRGWLQQMRSELSAVGADIKAFQRHVRRNNFAVLKFKVEDMELLDKPLEFQYGDPAVTSDYYNLKNYVQEPALSALSGEFVFNPGHNPPIDKKRLEYDRHTRDVNNHHNHVQAQLFAKLCEQYGGGNVGTENNTGAGTRVDLVVRQGDKYALYEIKTGPSLQSCVREAIGQLLEYRHMIGHSKVSKLVVVSPHSADKAVESYLSFIRTTHSIPIYYEQCNA